MKIIIAGGRDIDLTCGIMEHLMTGVFGLMGYASIPKKVEIVHGGCHRGIDSSVEWWAKDHFKITVFKADWDKHGKAAGPIRNREMAQYADLLILIWDGQSKGSTSMLKEAQKARIPIYQVIVPVGRFDGVN